MARTRTRSLILVTGCGLVLTAGFLIYYLSQPAPPISALPTTGPTTSVLTMQGAEGKAPIGPGSGVWITRYDQETGQRLARYKADQYTPRRDGRIDVVNPEAEFFPRGGGNGRVVHVRGKTGVFTVEPSLTSSNRVGEKLAMQPPSRGELHDVTIVVSQPGAPDTPAFTVTLNNAAFDNEEFAITSEAYIDPMTQASVAADEVPVVGIGADADFYGRGLLVRWNERDGQLELLEVRHGDHMVIKHPGKMQPQVPAASAAAPATAPATAEVAAAPASAPTPTPTLYRASFDDDVHVTQGDVELVTAQRMLADFVMDASTPPATQPATQPSVAAPATEPAPVVAQAAPAPALAPQQAPVVIRWTGPMRVRPLTPGDAGLQPVITFLGAPVIAHQPQAQISCAVLSYRATDAVLSAQDSPDTPLVITRQDAHGVSVVHCQTLNYERHTHVALLGGEGSADLPGTEPADGGRGGAGAQPLTAQWTHSCTVEFSGEGEGQMVMRRAYLEDDVVIDHPQLKLKSQVLTLDFDPPASKGAQGSLRELHAEGKVHCDMIDRERTQSIDSDKLHVVMTRSDDGRLLPRTVEADGSVRTQDPDRTLSAGHLAMTLGPATRPAAPSAAQEPSVQLETLDAHQDVRVQMKDGSVAQADTLALRRVDGRQTARLTGLPDVPARVTQGESVLDGARIDAWPDDHRVVVTGPGTGHGVQQNAAAPRSVDVAWTSGASYDGATNLVLATGDVNARSIDPADGSVQTASGATMTMHLTDAPPTTPAVQPAAQGMFAGKTVRDVTFANGATAGSVLLGADGLILKRDALLADTFTCGGLDAPGHRQLNVPVPGRMLVEDHRHAAAPASADSAEQQAAGERGSTAFAWPIAMSYDEAAGRMDMKGDAAHPVIVAHRDDGADAPLRRLTAPTIWGEVSPAAGQTRPEIRMLHADGGVLLYSVDDRLVCDRMMYDLSDSVVTAYGSDAANALFTREATDKKPPQEISAEELRWDTRQALPRAFEADIQLGR